MGSSTKTTMKLLSFLLALTLFFATVYSVPLQKANLVEEECEEEVAVEMLPALGVPDLVIDIRDNAPVENNEEDCEDEIVTEEPETEAAPLVTEECEDEIVTEEPEAQNVEATSECADEEVIEELPEVFEMALPDEDLVVEEECEE